MRHCKVDMTLGRFLNLNADELNAVAKGDYSRFSFVDEKDLRIRRVGYNTDKWKHKVGKYLYEEYHPDQFAIYFSGIVQQNTASGHGWNRNTFLT